ncbi:MAG: hypothetical protein WCX83_03125 [Candidatus Cloacimonas sp.]|nr:hypothetical protein [Candidatus Cloacimonadota bacterium]
MGQQQILLIVLSVILVGISIAVGITMFKSYSLTSNQDAIILDIITIGSLAYQHRLKPDMLGGGNGSFKGFNPPTEITDNNNAEYLIEINNDFTQITITATSKIYEGATIAATYNDNLELEDEFEMNGWD